MTFCEGFKVTDAEALAAAQLDREGVMRKITESFAYQVSRFSLFLYRFTNLPHLLQYSSSRMVIGWVLTSLGPPFVEGENVSQFRGSAHVRGKTTFSGAWAALRD